MQSTVRLREHNGAVDQRRREARACSRRPQSAASAGWPARSAGQTADDSFAAPMARREAIRAVNADHPPAPARSVAEGLARRLRKQTTCQRNGRVNLSCYVACMHINSSSSFSVYDYYIYDYSLFISRAEAGNHSPQYISMWQPYPSRRQRPPKRNTYPAEEINFTPSSRNTSKISVIGTRNGMPRSMVVSDSSAFKK